MDRSGIAEIFPEGPLVGQGTSSVAGDVVLAKSRTIAADVRAGSAATGVAQPLGPGAQGRLQRGQGSPRQLAQGRETERLKPGFGHRTLSSSV